MGQFSKVHTAPQRALDFGPGLGGLNQIYGHNHNMTHPVSLGVFLYLKTKY